MQLFQKIKLILQPAIVLFSNSAWLLSTEITAKISRIVTIVVLAGALTPVSYGTAMLALAFHDVLRLLLRSGAGSQIIRCDATQLPRFAKNGATIQWLICLTLALVQFSIAEIVATIYANPQLAELLKWMALSYVFYPIVSIKVFLLQRDNRLRWFSLRNGICIVSENLSIAIFALMGADIMAVALGKLVFSLLWLGLFWFAPAKGFGIGFDRKTFTHLTRSSLQLFGSEFLSALRMHSDTFIAAKLMPPEIFGIYSFAKSAGIGLSQSVCNAFNGALFPYLCKLQRQGGLEKQSWLVYRIALGVSLIFVLQALFVPIYVPIIFDSAWLVTIPTVSVLCLTAIPALIVDTHCSFQRTAGNYRAETLIRFCCLFITLLCLLVARPTQPLEFAIVLLFSAVLWCIAVFTSATVFNKAKPFLLVLLGKKSHEY